MPVPTDLSKLSNFVKHDVIKKADYNAKMIEIENKIPDISNLATKNCINYCNKIKYLILVTLLKRQIIALKSLK